GLRVYLSGRPPVSNMYESVIWVGWGAVVFSWIFARVQKFPMIMVAGTLAAVLCMIVADAAPVILDASLQPLTAVLRSNLWLTIHVLTISISYAAFFVAFFLGDIALAFYIKNEHLMKAQIDQLIQGIYLSTQVGVVLLATGTILGGVWADYSWGRFWGWDPKETWALIALLGYIAVLHGRLSGWLKGFGFAVGSVVSFSLVIMAWYGVNFVLGAGLHSYGFGGGGIEYVATFVGLHFVYVLVAVTIRQSRIKAMAQG
ncbi:MAG: cytochrome c biogenesis protein CcsA, partial [Bdellovibrionales bacterium]|nr:cytochrome c biogenesis protein CcsA [Bdellovibrionales bacterium]